MKTVTHTRPAPQATGPEWLMRPKWNRPTDATLPGSKTGILKLADGQCYLVEPVNNSVGVGLTLCKANGELYFVCLDANRGVGTCSCKGFAFRKQNLPCKHLTQVRDALFQLLEPDDVPEGYDAFDAQQEHYQYVPPERAFGFPDDRTPPKAPAALPVPARKPNHRFAAEYAA